MDLVRDLDHEQRLVHVLEDLAVYIFEIRCKINFLAVVNEGVLEWTRVIVDVLHEVAAVVSPVCDDWLATELKLRHLFGLMPAVTFLLDLKQSVKTGLGRHELEDVVNRKHTSQLALIRRGLES
jgi:hypothetical protein